MTDSKSTRTQEVEDLVDETNRIKHASQLTAMPSSLAMLAEAEYRQVQRRATLKLDIRIMPCMVLMYIMNYLDRQNIAAAKLANIDQDLNMTDVEYQTYVSVLFVGYILMQVPSNLVLGKIKLPGVYICFSMALWGVLSACTAAVHNFSGLVICRFFLGFIEAVFFPGALFYLSMFYTRKQYALRAAILYSGSQLGNAFGGLFAVAILKLDGKHDLEGWRWLFLVEGVATTGLAIILAFALPNSLENMSGFSELEHECLMWNFSEDQGQTDNTDEISALKGVTLAIRDPKTWLLMGILYSIYIAAAVSNFFPSVVATLGYSRNKTYGLTAPPYVLCVFAMILNGFHSDEKQERSFHIIIPMAVCLAANIIAVSTLNTAARYVAMMLMPGSFYAATVAVLSWVAGTLSQPSIKRASAIAIINAICNTPNIWASYLYYSPPRYLAAFLVNLAASGLAIFLTVVTRIYLRRHNNKLDRGIDLGRNAPTPAQISAGFRYVI